MNIHAAHARLMRRVIELEEQDNRNTKQLINNIATKGMEVKRRTATPIALEDPFLHSSLFSNPRSLCLSFLPDLLLIIITFLKTSLRLVNNEQRYGFQTSNGYVR